MTDPLEDAANEALQDAAHVLTEAERRMADRRHGRSGGRRTVDQPANAWSTAQLAYWIGMSPGFILGEVKTGELKASSFGGSYRIHASEVRRYLETKGFPVPAWMNVQA